MAHVFSNFVVNTNAQYVRQARVQEQEFVWLIWLNLENKSKNKLQQPCLYVKENKSKNKF